MGFDSVYRLLDEPGSGAAGKAALFLPTASLPSEVAYVLLGATLGGVALYKDYRDQRSDYKAEREEVLRTAITEYLEENGKEENPVVGKLTVGPGEHVLRDVAGMSHYRRAVDSGEICATITERNPESQEPTTEIFDAYVFETEPPVTTPGIRDVFGEIPDYDLALIDEECIDVENWITEDITLNRLPRQLPG